MFQDNNGRWRNENGSFAVNPYRNNPLSIEFYRNRSFLFHFCVSMQILPIALCCLLFCVWPYRFFIYLFDLNPRVTHKTNRIFAVIAVVLSWVIFLSFAPRKQERLVEDDQIEIVSKPSSSVTTATSTQHSSTNKKAKVKIISP